MAFDVGAIAREIQAAFRLFEVAGEVENRATPANLNVLLGSLTRLTISLDEQRDSLSDLVPDAGLIAWDLQLRLWKIRLINYQSAVDVATSGDRQAVLWTVTAPLLLGFYGGPDSLAPQQTLDAITPFSLANQLSIVESWREERLAMLQSDLKQGIRELGSFAIGGVAVLGAVVVGLLLLRRRMR